MNDSPENKNRADAHASFDASFQELKDKLSESEVAQTVSKVAKAGAEVAKVEFEAAKDAVASAFKSDKPAEYTTVPPVEAVGYTSVPPVEPAEYTTVPPAEPVGYAVTNQPVESAAATPYQAAWPVQGESVSHQAQTSPAAQAGSASFQVPSPEQPFQAQTPSSTYTAQPFQPQTPPPYTAPLYTPPPAPSQYQASPTEQAGSVPHRVQAPPYSVPQTAHPTKDRMAAGVLALLLGSLGAHKFYLGYTTQGLIMLLLTVFGGILSFGILAAVMGVVGFVEGILYLTKTQAEFEFAYVINEKPWF